MMGAAGSCSTSAPVRQEFPCWTPNVRCGPAAPPPAPAKDLPPVNSPHPGAGWEALMARRNSLRLMSAALVLLASGVAAPLLAAPAPAAAAADTQVTVTVFEDSFSPPEV